MRTSPDPVGDTTPKLDPFSVAGKAPPVEAHVQVLVVGAGPAGLAAAIAAARTGLSVLLVDENPIPPETMGSDVPLQFGARMSGAVRNRTAMLEACVAASPALAEAIEAGVEICLGTEVWGLYANGPGVNWLPGAVAGLTDHARAWLVGFDRAIVASGRRDMGLAFPGWQLPGVMGATAAERLAVQYGVLASRRAVVLGSSAEALVAAGSLRRAGVDIAAIIEPMQDAPAPAELVDPFAGVLRCGHTILSAQGHAGGVTQVSVAAVDANGRSVTGTEQVIECDTVILAIGAVPVIELLDAAGCRIGFDPDRGGHVPLTDAVHRTSLPWLFAIGDCAGVWAEKTLNPAVPAAEGHRAAAQAAADLGVRLAPAAAVPAPASRYDVARYRLAWVRSTMADADTEICQCEGVTVRDILEVRPPRYLGWEPVRRNLPPLAALLASPPHPDQVKRLTRAGMGLCQGRRCREQVACLLAIASNQNLADIPLASHRAPVRPMPLALLATLPQAESMGQGWDTWFGIATQMTGFWDIDADGK